MTPTCQTCGHKHHPYEEHAGDQRYSPWDDLAVNTDRARF